MLRKSAGDNMRLGIALTVIAFLMLVVAFAWATLYLAAAHG